MNRLAQPSLRFLVAVAMAIALGRLLGVGTTAPGAAFPQDAESTFQVLPVLDPPFTASGVQYSGAGTWTFATEQGPRTMASGDWVRCGALVDPAAGPQIYLAGGGMLVVAEVEHLADGVLHARHDVFGPLEIPAAAVAAVVLHPPSQQAARDALYDAMQTPTDAEGLFLANGDRLAGRVREFSATAAVVLVRESPSEVPRGRIAAIRFADPAPPTAGNDHPPILVGLRDGSLLRASSLTLADQLVRIETPAGVTLTASSPDVVCFLQPLSERIVYLSDLEADGFVHQPFLDLAWPYHRDRNVTGGRLRAAGALWSKGLGMHSGGRIAYRLDPRDQWFQAEVAIDDQTKGRGSVRFQVYLANNGAWSLAWSSPVVRGGDAPLPVRVELSGAQGVALAVDYADQADQWDRANWLDARLIRPPADD